VYTIKTHIILTLSAHQVIDTGSGEPLKLHSAHQVIDTGSGEPLKFMLRPVK
jgi:hypothetical protein